MSNQMRLADYVAQTVARQGTDAFFMLSGGMMMHLMDAFGRIPSMRYYCNHHEQASAMAADAYARESGRLGLCLATSGPGATNIVTGLVGAYQDSVPVLFLTGQCKRRETVRGRGIKGLRQCGFLEADIVPIVESVTKYAVFVNDPADIRFHLEKAIHLAITGRPGPVLLDLPLDVQGAPIDPAGLRGYTPEPVAHAEVASADLGRIFDAVQSARRPLILAGHGVRAAGLVREFRALIDRWQVPVATSLMAKDLLPEDHPLYVGHPGPRAQRGANFVIQSADVIVTMGCSLHIQTVGYEGDLFAPGALKIQLDLDRAVLEREHVGSNWKFAWDLRDYLPKLDQLVRGPWAAPGAGRWREVSQSWKTRFSSRNEKHQYGPTDARANLYEFCDILAEEMPANASILTDAGQPHPILAQAFRLKEGQRYLNPGSFAEMGYALPAAFGAAVAAPDKTIVSVFGDGSLQTNIQELQTLVHHKFNVKVFVINNDGYASIRNTQKTFFGGFYVGSTADSGVTLPDTAKICAAYGLSYVRCPDRGALRATIRQVLAQPGPVLCEVMAQPDQRILPAVASKLLPDGTMRSNALHQMAPEIEIEFAEIAKELG
jgi:acetolactate synthase-1/2/3 large subunit